MNFRVWQDYRTMSTQPFRDSSNRSASTATTPVSKMMRGLTDCSISKTPGSAGHRSLFSSKTPTHGLNQSIALKKGVAKRQVTPSRNQNFNGVGGADRYMPNRSSSQFEFANYQLTHSMVSNHERDKFNTSSSAPCSPAKQDEDRQKMMKMMRVKSTSDLQTTEEEDRILVYKKSAAPKPPVGHLNSKVLYSTCIQPSSSVKKSSRYIPNTAERVLDAPQFSNDYYSECMDWGASDIVAIALSHSLYMWGACNGEIDILFEMNQRNALEAITAVKWANEGKFLAVGFQDGHVRLFDPSRQYRQELRKLSVPRVSKVTCMSWRGHILSAGYDNGEVYNFDVRIKDPCVGVFAAHTRPVCGIHWADDEKAFASGGGDNVVNVWDDRQLNTRGQSPQLVLNDHLASVKAVQFCPFKRSQLATGGGSGDHAIKIWNINDGGTLMKSIDTGAQVTAIRFNSDYKEMISSQGSPSSHLKIWKYPTWSEVATLEGHSDRVLCMAMSSCGQYVISGGADESLRLWHPFKVDKSTQKLLAGQKNRVMSTLGSIR